MSQRLYYKVSSALWLLLAVFGLAAVILILEKPTGTAKGLIVGEDGHPLANAQISFDAYPVVRKARSDGQGIFLVDQLPVGNYYVSVTHKGYQPSYLQEHKVGEGQVLDFGSIPLKELDPNLTVAVWNNTKTPEEKVTLSISGAKVRQIHFDAYKIDLPGLL